MSRPRFSRISSSERSSRFCPSNRIWPRVTRPVLASRRMIASAETDLPQPLTLPSDERGSDIAERSSAADTSGGRACAALVHEDGMNTSFFGEMLQTISERGRALIDRTRDRRSDAAARSHSLIELCEELLSRRGEASGVALAREIFVRYDELTTGPRIAFFEALSTRFGVDRE